MARMTLQMDGDYHIKLMRMPSVLKHRKPLLLYAGCGKQTYCLWSVRTCWPVIRDTRLEPVAVVDAYVGEERSPSFVIRIRSMVVLKFSSKPKKRVSITRFLSFKRDKCCAWHQMLTKNSLVNLDKDAPRLTEVS